jgi:hypothetical protein
MIQMARTATRSLVFLWAVTMLAATTSGGRSSRWDAPWRQRTRKRAA